MTAHLRVALCGVLLGIVGVACVRSGSGDFSQEPGGIPCAPFGQEIEMGVPEGTDAVGAWPRAIAFAQGALLASVAPGALTPFADRPDTAMSPALSTDSIQVCIEARDLGRVGAVSFIQVLLDLKRPAHPVEKGEVFLGIGPDSAHFLIGHDRVLHSPFRNVPRVNDLNVLLSRYGLAREGPAGNAQRLEVAAVLLGGATDVASYRTCRTNPAMIVATVNDGYRRGFTLIEFARSGKIVGTTQVDSLGIEC